MTPAAAIRLFLVVNRRVGLMLPDGWFGRPRDDQRRVTRVKMTGDGLLIELDDRDTLAFTGSVRARRVNSDLRLEEFDDVVFRFEPRGGSDVDERRFSSGSVTLVSLRG